MKPVTNRRLTSTAAEAVAARHAVVAVVTDLTARLYVLFLGEAVTDL